ncbi:hypothetical protein JCM10212_000929 [Sporobolomyces blumeae]
MLHILLSALTISQVIAAPTLLTACDAAVSSCSPNISAQHTTAIAPKVDYEQAWFIFENDDGRMTNRNAHDIYEGVKYNNNFVVSQTDGKTDQYRLTSAVVDGRQYCIAAVDETTILDAVCEDDLAAWTIECQTCDTSLYGNGQACQIKSTTFGTCATLAENGLVDLEECAEWGQVPQSEDVGNQTWDVI